MSPQLYLEQRRKKEQILSSRCYKEERKLELTGLINLCRNLHIRLAHVIITACKGYDKRHGTSLYDKASNKKLTIWSAFIFSVQKNPKSYQSVIIVLIIRIYRGKRYFTKSIAESFQPLDCEDECVFLCRNLHRTQILS